MLIPGIDILWDYLIWISVAAIVLFAVILTIVLLARYYTKAPDAE